MAATVGVALAGRDSSSSSGSFVPPATDGSVNQQSAATNKLDIGVVDIDTRLGFDNARAAGTGIVLTSSGEVLTNDHVISGATSIKVTVVTTGRTYTATVLGSDATDDIALLQLKDASGLQAATLGDSSTVAVGDSVTAVGNAGGVGGIPSVVTGTVTALDQSITVSDENGGRAEDLSGLIETNAALQPGDSGGPLYDASGKVIGIDTAASGGRRFRVTGRDSFAIAINNANAIRKQIEAGQGSDKVQIGQLGFLGVEISGSASDGSSGGGVPVSSVISGTPAEKIGLAAGDLITAVDGKSVDSEQALTAALHGHHPGDKVKVTWTDSSGQEHSATATLAEGPAS